MSAIEQPAEREAFPYGPPHEVDARFCPWCYRERDADGNPMTCSVQAHWPEHTAPIYLTGCVGRASQEIRREGLDIGFLVTPDTKSYARHDVAYDWWAADNGVFGAALRGEPFDYLGWWEWLTTLPSVCERRRCLFATAPDVIGDMAATWESSRQWLHMVRLLGIPVALVAQNGAADFAPMWDHADEWDVLFVGGSLECRCGWVKPMSPPDDWSPALTGVERAKAWRKLRNCLRDGGLLAEWKLSEDARLVVREAQSYGKWVHMGRVSSRKRMELCKTWRVDSADGTFLGFGPDVNGPKVASWLRAMRDEPRLF